VHSSVPSKDELISFNQCISVLSQHEIFIIAPTNLDISVYTNLYPSIGVKFVDKDWLISVKAYNKMKINRTFYKLFSNFEYMLTYELDSYVFQDNLFEWCTDAYDYIGAPWFAGYDEVGSLAEIIGVGNSGLSVRNVQRCLSVLEELQPLVLVADRSNNKLLKYIFRYFTFVTRSFPRLQARLYIIRAYLQHEYIHEDIFWAVFIPRYFSHFKVADVSSALRFSFDANPRKCFELSGNVLPFGCHAWKRYDCEFWAKFILKDN
jgi:hypothetical protein